MVDLTHDQLRRYTRHIMLDAVGGPGQSALLSSHVLVVGAGGLGAPVLEYLAAAGVGTLTVMDGDRVDLSNLQRQVIHATPDIGRLKVASAAERIAALNPDVTVNALTQAADDTTAPGPIAAADLVLDCTDSFEARMLLNRLCVAAGKPFLSAALQGFEGQLALYEGHRPDRPCFACVFPDRPPEEDLLTCAEAGILGATAGVIGTLQATEALKHLLGLETLSGRFLLADTLSHTWRVFNTPKMPGCAVCNP